MLDMGLQKIEIETDSGLKLEDVSASESEEESKGVFYALASRVRDEVKRRVKSLRADDPAMQDSEAARANGKDAIDDWAEKISTHILYAIQKHDGLLSIESASFRDSAPDDQNSSILKLSDEATEFVDRLIEENDGLLTDFYSRETVPPMICQPRTGCSTRSASQ